MSRIWSFLVQTFNINVPTRLLVNSFRSSPVGIYMFIYELTIETLEQGAKYVQNSFEQLNANWECSQFFQFLQT